MNKAPSGKLGAVHYPSELGVRFEPDARTQTGDIDFASFEDLSVALNDRNEQAPDDILHSLKLDPVPSVSDRPIWKWRQRNGEAIVEFLTPACGDQGVKLVPAPGVKHAGLERPRLPHGLASPRCCALPVGRLDKNFAIRAVCHS